MSDAEMITIILVINITYILFLSWHIAKIADEVHMILEQLKNQDDGKEHR